MNHIVCHADCSATEWRHLTHWMFIQLSELLSYALDFSTEFILSETEGLEVTSKGSSWWKAHPK
jgi:hypothetical protein